jgi:outer membrane protein insertion porin family
MRNSLIRQISRYLIGGLFAAWLAIGSAFAAEPFKIADIRVEGLQRVEAGTVFASLPFRVGETYSDDKGSLAIRSLFGLSLFKDVRIEIDGGVVVVVVQERPSVADISFTGLKEFKPDALTRMLKDIGLGEGRPYDKAIEERAVQIIKSQYGTRGMYGVEIVTTATPLPRNRVNLNFGVVEGAVATIKTIRIVGSQAFAERDLLDLLNLDSGNWMSWYTKSDRYDKTKLNADLETLRSHYLTKGYLDFKVESTQVAISPDKQAIDIVINISEGRPYAVSEVRLEGNYLSREAEFLTQMTVKAGEAYNESSVSETLDGFSRLFGDFGYAFARIEPKNIVDSDSQRVVVVLQASPGQRAYVRRIEVQGNLRTRDEVIRREMRQAEASWYDGRLIRLSRDRIDRLGYFTSVAIQNREVPDAPDQVDLVLSVVERPTGNLSIGAGFGDAEGLSLVAGIEQENVFGSGQSVRFNINTSSFNRTLQLSTTDPFYTNDGVSRTYDVSYTTNKPLDTQGGSYEIVRKRANINFGVPISELDRIFVGAGVESTSITNGNSDAQREFVSEFGSPATGVPLTLGWSRDSRDSFLAPTEGRYQRINTEVSVAGDTRYIKADYQFQQYWPLTKRYTFAMNTEVGYGKGLGGKSFPLLKNYYGGGLGSVRGFEQGTLGGTSPSTTDSLTQSVGGSRSLLLNTELIAPFPGVGNDRTLRMFAFVDVGNVYCTASATVNCASNALRASSGFGISWLSPVGPLRLAYTTPIKKEVTDRTQKIQFQIGTAF